ncbi:hypothetical protein F5B18DRAFT_484650 [Nemania serpens]|nr:hypothetical protein F5B18DRAFT_484650 [Nemania serpens]
MLRRVRFLAESESESSSSDGVHPSRFEREDGPEPQVRAPAPGPRGRGSGRRGIRLRSRVGISNHEARILRDGTIIRGKQGATFAGFVPSSRTSSRVPPPPPDRSLSPPPPPPPPPLSPSLPPLQRQKLNPFSRPRQQVDNEEIEFVSLSSWSDSSIESPEAPEHTKPPEYTSTTACDATHIGAQRPDSSACKRSHPNNGDLTPSAAESPAKRSKL